MKNITFITSFQSVRGTLNAEFASKWKRKVSPELVAEGRKLSKEIASNKNPNIETLRGLSNKRNKLKATGLSIKKGLYEITDHTDRHGRGFSKNYYLDPVRGDRMNRLTDNIMEKRGISKPPLKITPQPEAIYLEDVRPKTNTTNFEPLVEKKSIVIREEVKTPKISPSNPSPPKQNVGNVKVSPNATKTPLLQPKKLPLGKIGLGAVGLATIGALGYGLLRKSRNDKGRKRGSYRK